MLATVLSGALVGIDGLLVEVEVDVALGLPQFTTVGLPEGAVKESREARSPASTPPGGEVQRHRTRLKQQDITWPPQDTQTRSRPIMGKDGPSDSALAAARGWRLRRTAADRHAARCASRALCSGGAPR